MAWVSIFLADGDLATGGVEGRADTLLFGSDGSIDGLLLLIRQYLLIKNNGMGEGV